MDWYFLVRDTNRAAEFWIVCNLWICPAGNPWRRLTKIYMAHYKCMDYQALCRLFIKKRTDPPNSMKCKRCGLNHYTSTILTRMCKNLLLSLITSCGKINHFVFLSETNEMPENISKNCSPIFSVNLPYFEQKLNKYTSTILTRMCKNFLLSLITSCGKINHFVFLSETNEFPDFHCLVGSHIPGAKWLEHTNKVCLIDQYPL